MTERSSDRPAGGQGARRRALDVLGEGGSRAAVCVIASLRFFESIAWLVAFVCLGRGAGSLAIAIAVASSASSFARRLTQTRLLRSLRLRIVGRIARSALSESAILSAPDADADPLAHFFDGGYIIAQALSEGIPVLAADVAATMVLGGVLLVAEPGPLVAGVAIAVGISVGFALAVWRTSVARFAVEHQRLGELTEPMLTLVTAREELLASGRSRRFLDDLDARAIRWVDAAARASRIASVGGRVPALAVAGFVVAATIVRRGGIAGLRVEELAPLGMYASILRPLAGALSGSLDLPKIRTKLDALPWEASPTLGPKAATAPLPRQPPAALRWRHVSYSYPSGGKASTNVIVDFDAEWARGTIVVLGGPNGAGKSTLLRLLLGIVQPTRGEICVGDTALRDVDLDAWRQVIAYVPQRPRFPERATVREAIAFGGLTVSDAAAEEALEGVAMLEPLRRASRSAPLDVRVDSLSAGQRQRVALTRAFREDAHVVILDEPDANLDSDGVALLCRRLEALAKDRIVVVAAHSTDLARIAGNSVRLTNRAAALPAGA